jgi:hypothetical protein
VALANLAAAAAVNVGLFLVTLRVLTPQQIPTRQLVAGALVAGVAWQVLQAVGGYLGGHYLRHTSQVYGAFAIVLGLLFWAISGRAAHPVRRRSQRRGRPTALAAQPGTAAVGQRRPTRPRVTSPTNRNADLRRPPGSASPPTSHTHEANAATPLPVASHQQDVAAPQSSTPGQHRDVGGHDAPAGRRAPNGIGQRRARAWCRRRP